MASSPTRPLASLLLAVALLAGCSTTPPSETDVAGSTATPPAPSSGHPGTTPASPSDAPSPTGTAGTEDPGTETPSTSDEPATVAPPDLSGNEVDCDEVDEPCDYGDDAELDRLWDACAGGDGTACDRLYYDSAFDTRYEQFGNTCGDRGMTTPCSEELDA